MLINGADFEITCAIPAQLNIFKYSLIPLSPVPTLYTKNKNNEIQIQLDQI